VAHGCDMNFVWHGYVNGMVNGSVKMLVSSGRATAGRDDS
jgi:hypothetical protein